MTNSLTDFDAILSRDKSLAPFTWLKLGGPARSLYQPETKEQLISLVQCCFENSTPVKILGGGSNILVADSGVDGAVIRVMQPLLDSVSIDGTTVKAEGGTLLSHVVSESVRADLAGLESLVGIPGTVGAAVAGNSGGRHGDIGGLVTEVEVLTQRGEQVTRSGDELAFSYRNSSINDLIVLSVTMQLKQDDPEQLAARMKKTWIMKRATQPLADQSAGCIFRNPRGLSAGALIEQCGLKDMAVGGARISDRHANFVVTNQEASSEDVMTLVSRIQKAVQEKFGVDLELEIHSW